MKTLHIFGITLLLIVLIFGLVAAASIDHPKAAAQNLSAAALPLKIATPTPAVKDKSEVGSTTGIVIMGIFLAIIIILPLLILRKRK
jgi:hypothetical protein